MGIKTGRRDVVLIQLGKVGQSIEGHEQAGKRLCVIIKPLNRLELAVVVPVTTRKPRGIPSIVRLTKGAGELDKESYVLCHQIRTISYKRIVHTIGMLTNHEFNKIRWSLSNLFGL